MPKVGYLGPKGTFSHEAVNEYTKGKTGYTICDYGTFHDIIFAVNNGEIDEAIVPIENSIEGAVAVTLDMLAFDVDLFISHELVLPVRQNLLVRKGTDVRNIKYILSHYQPIGQCRKYIAQNFPCAEVRHIYSTAGAAEEVAKGANNAAAIGSAVAAEVYGLDILDSSIQDENSNMTRFVVLSKKESGRTGRDKTSVVFSTDNKPGSLYRVLDIFSLWDINMMRIESRPAKNQLGRYIFFIDLAGHRDDVDVTDALTMVRRKTSFFKFLGSYPEYPVSD